MSNSNLDNNYLPKRMNIILYTKIDKSSRMVYTPQMSIPNISSRFVNFNPLIKINEKVFSNEYKINLKQKGSLNENIIDILLNKQKFNNLLNLILVKTGKKELSIQESCTNKVIDNNIKFTLDILFKPGNNLEINKKQYTIVKYSWLDGDWLIYSDDIKKGSEEQDKSYSYFNHKRYIDETSEHMVTKNAFNKLNKVIPDCLKGTTKGNSLLVTGDKEILKEQEKKQTDENKITIEKRIKNFFDIKEPFKLSENDIYLPYNLSYNTPSFLKDPISVSLFYLEYNFKKETNNNKKLEKTFNELNEKRQKLEELEKTIFKYTGSIEERPEIEAVNVKLDNDKTENSNNLKLLTKHNKTLKQLLSVYTSKSCGYNTNNTINIQLDKISHNIKINNHDNIETSIIQINKDINSCNKYNSHINHHQKTDIINQFNMVINLINEKIQNLDKKQKEYTNDMTLNELEQTLNTNEDPSIYITSKKKYLELCRTILENILQKINMENDYLLLLITFYKQLYTYKKNELNSTYALTSDQKWLLTIINQIILFDLIIYNTISSDCKQNVIDTQKLINEYIETIKKLQTIKYNIKDEKINKKKDLPILSSYKYAIYYVNNIINMNIWKIFSSKTLELNNNFSTIVSKTIQNYHKLNESFSHASEYETKLKNIKYTCFDLITIYSRMTMICFLRNYICNKYNTSFYHILNENIISINPPFNPKNKYYLDISAIINYKYEPSLNNDYQDYINSVKMLTPSITSTSIENICNKLVTQEVEKDNIFFIQAVEKDELTTIINDFVDASLNELFDYIDINNIQIIAYTNFLLNTAVENGINWYLCRENKMFDNKYPVKVDDVDLSIIEDYYKINICIIENNPRKASKAIINEVLELADNINDPILKDNIDNIKDKNNDFSTKIQNVIGALTIISRQKNVETALKVAKYLGDNNKKPTLVLTPPHNYKKTLYIFKNDDKFYTMLQNNGVALLDNTITDFYDKIPQINQPIKGGASQKEEIESIMNQSILDNLLQNPNDDNNKHIISKNTLAYVVPIKIELYEGKDVPLSKKVESSCEDNYNNILEAWKLLFKLDEDDDDSEPTQKGLFSSKNKEK
jgi:hypothetical protein